MGKKHIEETLSDETDKLVREILAGCDGVIGGFPCQDISIAGNRKGIQRDSAGEATTRSGLFWEMVRIVCLVRPRFWLMENVAELLNRHLGGVLSAVPPAGMMQNGIAWQRQPLAHPTIADEFTCLPTPLATEGCGTSRKRFKGSPNFRGTRTAEALRTSYECPAFLNPLFAEMLMGLPKDYTVLETQTLHASSEN
jgi:hypothetical protein